MSSPSQRTLERCRRLGWRAAVVEKWIQQARRRIDLWGFADLIAMDGDPGARLIQVTTASNASSRIKKIQHECRDDAARWLRAGNRISVLGWRKAKKGKRVRWVANHWRVRLGDSGLLVASRDDEEVAV